MTEVLPNDASIRVITTVAAQKLYDFDFLAYTASSVFAVFKTVAGVETVLTSGVHFTVAGLGVSTGGTIDITASGIVSAVDDTILIYRSVPIERTTDYSIELRASVFNRELDLGIMIDQELRRDVDRSVKVPQGAPGIIIEAGAAGEVPVFDAVGNLTDVIEAGDISGAQGNAAIAAAAAITATAAKNDAEAARDIVLSAVEGISRPVDITDILVGDGGANDTAGFIAALQTAEANGSRQIINRNPTKKFKLKRIYLDDYVTGHLQIYLGHGKIFGEFKGADVPNNVANIFRTRGGYASGFFNFTTGATNTNPFTVGDTIYTLTSTGDPASGQFWRGENAEASAEATAFALAAAVNGEVKFSVISFTGASGAFVEGADITGLTSGSVSRIEAVFYEPASTTDGVMFVLDATVPTSNLETLTSGAITAISHGISRTVISSTGRINAKARARQVGTQCQITALKEGTDGNLIALAETSTGATVSGPTLTGGRAGLSISVYDGEIDGQDDGTSSSGTGEPMIHFIGGDKIIFYNTNIKNGGNRYSGLNPRRLMEHQNAEVLIEGDGLVQFIGGKVSSHWGEAVQLQSHNAELVYQIIGTQFSKRRSNNPKLSFSNSSFNAFNCSPASFAIGWQFFDHIKSATNIVHHGGTFIDTLIDGVYDSNGLDFNEAGNFKFDGAKVINITLRNIAACGVRTAGSNISIDGVDEENVLHAVRLEPALGVGRRQWFEPWINTDRDAEFTCEIKRVTSRGSGVRLPYDAQTAEFTAGKQLTQAFSGATATILHVYDNGTTGVLLLRPPSGVFVDNQIITDTGGGSAMADLTAAMASNEAVIDVVGVSAVLPVQLTVDGMLDKLNPLLERHNFGIDAGHTDLVLKGYLDVGDTAMVRQNGFARTHSQGAKFKADKDAGTRHVLLYDAATIDHITLEDYHRFGALNGGASDIRFLNAPTISGIVNVLRPKTVPISNSAIICREGMISGTLSVNPPPMNPGDAGSTHIVTVTGAAVGDLVVGASCSVALLAGFAMTTGRVTTNAVEVNFSNVSAAASADPGGPFDVTVYVQKAK